MPRLAVLAALSLLCSVGLSLLHLPAAILTGCMLAGIALAVNGRGVSVPAPLFAAAQGVIGCLIARSLPMGTLGELLAHWPVFLGSVLAVIAASGALGWGLMRRGLLPGTTAVWGLAPGAASAMMLLSKSFGADMRLVAFMQYLRIVLITALASVIAAMAVPHAAPASSPTGADLWTALLVEWGSLGDATAVAQTVALGGVCVAVAVRWRLPAGALLLPMVVGIVCQGAGWMRIELPPALLAMAYVAVGWTVGSRFDRPIIEHALRALPAIVMAIAMLVLVSMVLAVLLTWVADVDLLTAYLAMSPGGADSIAIIAASSSVNVPFVMTMQTARFVAVLLIGPSFTKFIARRAQPVA